MSTFAPTIEAFFTERLITQRQASSRTVAAYRDTLSMLLVFAQARTGKAPSQLDVADIDARLVGAFLTHLEEDRHNTARTRNTRLAGIRSLFATPLSATPSTRSQSSESWPSPTNATTEPRSASSQHRRWMRCSPHPNGLRGSEGEITRCSCSPSKQGCESAS